MSNKVSDAVKDLRAIRDKYVETIYRRFEPEDVQRIEEALAVLEREVKA